MANSEHCVETTTGGKNAAFWFGELERPVQVRQISEQSWSTNLDDDDFEGCNVGSNAGESCDEAALLERSERVDEPRIDPLIERLLAAHCPYEKMTHGAVADQRRQRHQRKQQQQKKKKKKNQKKNAKKKQKSSTKPLDSTVFQQQQQNSTSWVVTEKVHGANFAFVSDGERVLCASRKNMLNPAEQDFMSCYRTGLVQRHEPLVLDLVQRVREMIEHEQAGKGALGEGRADVVWIFGEAFGGGFPGKQSPEGTVLVQHGIFYSPRLEFIAFDVAWASLAQPTGGCGTSVDELSNSGTVGAGGCSAMRQENVESAEIAAATVAGDDSGESQQGIQQRTYLGFLDAMRLCTEAGILATNPLMEGTRSECAEFDPYFNSTIPERLGHKALPAGVDQNLAEGVVVRPANTREIVRLVPGKTQRGGRSMFKRKIAEFAEIAHSKGGTARSRQLLGGGCTEFSREDNYKQPSQEDLVWYEALARLNEQRVDSAVSKTGVVDKNAVPSVQNAKFDEIMELVLGDIEEELEDELNALEMHERQRILSRARAAALPIIKTRAVR